MIRRPRSGSLCSMCGGIGNVRDWEDLTSRRRPSTDRGRTLSLEIDGKEGRQRQRHRSASNSRNAHRSTTGSGMHCYIIPTPNGQGPEARSSTTYREAFCPPSSQAKLRHTSSSVTSSPVTSPTSSSPATTPISNKQSFSDPDTQALVARLPTRLNNNRDTGNGGQRVNTTYRDHFHWMSWNEG